MKTVFFGPFIGEFGWEVLYWSAWINRLIDEKYKNCHIIVASQGGRELFYPKANEFWPLPDWFCDVQYVQTGYISDGWENGLPRGNFSRVEKLFGIIERERWGYAIGRGVPKL